MLGADMRRCFLLPLLIITAGCGPQHTSMDVGFVATIEGAPTACSESGVAMSDLRFYVSDIRLGTDDGRPVTAAIIDRAPWQNADAALVDLENGSGSCRNGTLEMNDSVTVSLPPGNYRSIAMTIGVPFERNHENPLSAVAPLNDSAMHWHWRSGYKFLRAGSVGDAGEAWIHLGSTGCEGTVGNISGCTSPNRVRVELENFDPETDRIAVDLSALLNAEAMNQAGERTDCSSGPAEQACEPPFSALGLRQKPQQVFSVHR